MARLEPHLKREAKCDQAHEDRRQEYEQMQDDHHPPVEVAVALVLVVQEGVVAFPAPRQRPPHTHNRHDHHQPPVDESRSTQQE